MLLELPKEILITILGFLRFQDRLNLARSCHRLRILISERHLYEELPTFKSEWKLQVALDLFKNYPMYGSQVKRIRIKLIITITDALSQLPFVFPNIREFRTNIPWGGLEPEIGILLKWKDTIELLHIEHDGSLYSSLTCNTFSRLSFLKMSLPSSFFAVITPRPRNTVFDNNTRNPGLLSRTHLPENHQSRNRIQNYNAPIVNQNLKFFDCFKNTPSLRHLELCGGDLCLQHLEKLHVVCPQLTSLNLSVNIYVGDVDVLPSFIEPVTQLRSLKLDVNSRIYNEKNRILDYLAAKYTNLNKFIYLAKDLDQQYDYNTKESIRKKREFISSLRSTIKILKLNIFGFEDPIGALQESALDPIELALYTSSMNGVLIPASVTMYPRYLHYIQNLKSLKSLTLEWNSIMENSSYGIILNNISNLTVKIQINESRSSEDIIFAITSVCPSLKCLKVTSDRRYYATKVRVRTFLTPTGYTLSKVTCPNLRKLLLDPSVVSVSLIERILTSCPNMNEVTIQNFSVEV